ncbi:hypothetical protein ACFXG4_18185 [Nocardia sp. NPDC059246]|uniref:hypothetical protein n=1 Tax=unclassified Nocardia TaxID=2637762 RepID=UPI0036918749
MNQMTFQRICAWTGIVCPLVFFGGLVVAGMFPPMLPSQTTAEVVAHYRDHANGVRAGAAMVMLSSMFYASFTAVISGQIQRIPGVHPTVVFTQLAGGAFACVTFLLPGLLFVVTAFRPERSPELTVLMNDLSWIFLVMPFPPVMVQGLAFAYAIFSDNRSRPLFPRWLGYVNIWVLIMFFPAVLLPFFRSGPFSWGGIFVFWVPATVFGIQFFVNVVMVLKAIGRPESEDALHLQPHGGVLAA